MFDLLCGMKTQLLDYETNIPLSDLENRISGNLEGTLSLRKCEGDNGGTAVVNLQVNS